MIPCSIGFVSGKLGCSSVQALCHDLSCRDGTKVLSCSNRPLLSYLYLLQSQASFGNGMPYSQLLCYEASLDPALHRKSLYVFDAKAVLSDDDLYLYCKSPNLFIHGLNENFNVKSLLRSEPSVLGPHVLKLSLKGSVILEGSFVDVLKKCEFLEGLDICGCNSLFMPGNFLQNNEHLSELEGVLAGLKDLNLSSIRYLDDKSLKTLISITPHIESLSLASCNICFSDFGISQRHALTFPTILQLISARSSTLTQIDLSQTGITNTALQTLASTVGVELRELVLQNCREIGDSGIINFVKRQRFLNVLDLRGCLEIGNQALSGICANLPALRKLYIAKCRKINDTSAVRLLSLDELRVLDISECYDITKSIHLILASLPNLRHFIANGCNFTKLHEQIELEEAKSLKIQPVTNGYIDTRRGNFSCLTKLSIASGKYVTDHTIQCIFKYSTNLEDLSMSWCHYITDRGLLGAEVDLSLLPEFPSVNIEKVEFLNTGRFSTTHGRSGFLGSPGSEYKCLEGLFELDMQASISEKGIGRLKKLKRLALSNCRNVSNASLIQIFRKNDPIFPLMEHLDLNMMAESVTDVVLNGISFGCPLLTRLAISCSKVSNDGVEAVIRRLRRLESLDLSNCDCITPRFFSLMIKNSKWLRELDISSCKQIPATSVKKLRLSLPLLTRVHTRYAGI